MRAFLIVLVYAALVLALQTAASLGPTPQNWGVHHYGFLPGAWLWGGALAALAVAGVAWLRSRAVSGRPAPRGPRVVLGGVLVAVGGAVLFWIAREQSTFMGDGSLYVEGVRRGRLLAWSEPGALLLQVGLNRLLGSPDPMLTFAAASVAAGVAYLLLARAFARTVSEDHAGCMLVFGLLALAGLTRLFYGYVETYPILAAATALYILLAVRALQGKGRLWPVALVGALVPVLHFTGVFLWPSLVYVLWVGARGDADASGSPRGGGDAPRGPRGRRLALLLIPAAVLTAGVIARGGLGAFSGIVSHYAKVILPLSGPTGVRVPYTLFEGAHLRDLLQEQWLIGPFGALLAILLLAARAHDGLRREGRFLLWAAIPWWLFSLVFNREIGAARDWDLFAVASLPWIMLVGLLLARGGWRAQRPVLAGATAAVLLGVSFFHTLPWVAIGADTDRSMAHFAALYGPKSEASPFARSYAFEEIGTWYLDRGQSESAVAAYREAALADSTNARVTANLGAVLLAQGKAGEAAEVLELALKRDSKREFAYFQLGNAYRELGKPDEAGSAYRKALGLNPDFTQATLNYATLERQRGNFPLAEALLQDARRRAPNDADVLAHLARLQDDKGDTAAAAATYRAAIAANPEDVASTFNLGYLLMRQGKAEEASRCFEQVTARTPADAEAWINLGVAREVIGDSTAALAAYERAIAADPRRPEPYFNLARASLAAADTAAAARRLRAYAVIDSTGSMGRLARQLLAEMERRGRR